MMLASLMFSLVGTMVFAMFALGLVWLMARLGGGQRIRVTEGRPHTTDGMPQRPATRRTRR